MEKFNFEQVKEKLTETRREMLVLLSNQAQNYFLSSFAKQGFNGKSWEEVQRREPGTKAYKYPKKKGLQRRTSPILIGAGWKVRGGTLRRAVSNMARTAKITNTGFRMVIDLPYAKIQNEGGTINMAERSHVLSFSNKKRGFVSSKHATHQQKVKIGAHTVTIPERRFVGQTSELTQMQEKKMKQIIDRTWKA